MKIRTLPGLPRHATVVLITAVFSVLAAIGPAAADSVTTPPATSIVFVGDHVDDAAMDSICSAYNATSPASPCYNYDSAGSSPITPKAGAITAARPYGCDPGVALLNSTTSSTVDSARCGRNPRAGGNIDWFIPFATDAVGWAGYTGGNAPHGLSTTDLKYIYSCAITNWNQIVDEPGYTGPNAPIDVFLPPVDSSMRAFFLAALGMGPDGPNPLGPPPACWRGDNPQDSEGTNPAFQNDPNAIIPYSLGHYIGQVYRGLGSGTDRPGALDANRSIDGVEQIDTVNHVFNTAISLNYRYALYNVVRQADWADPVKGPRLKALLARPVAGGWLCSHPSAIISTGFLNMPGCGSLSAGI